MVVICMESAGILAGPMLRRAHTDYVAISVAADCPVEVDAPIYKLDTLSLETATKTTSVRAGKSLFIHSTDMYGQIPTDTFLGYDLFFRVGPIMYCLKSSRMNHKNEDSATYGGLPYPSFFIPASAAPNFRILS